MDELSFLMEGRTALGARRRVRMDAVAATVSDGNRYIDELFCKRIERSRLNHHLFDARPYSLEKGRLIRESASEIIYKICLRVSPNTALTAGRGASGPHAWSAPHRPVKLRFTVGCK